MIRRVTGGPRIEDNKLAGNFELNIEENNSPTNENASNSPPTVDLAPLQEQEIQDLYARLPAIEQKRDDGAPFFRREDTSVPPTAQQKVEHRFPPEESATAAPTATSSNEPLRVINHYPEGQLASCDRVTVTFSEPVVSLTTLSQLDNIAELFTIEPRPAGKFKYDGTSTVAFQADKPFPKATKYVIKVPAGTASTSGNKTATEHVFDITLPPPVFRVVTPSQWQPTGQNPVFVWSFDQLVAEDEVIKRVKAVVDGKEFPAKKVPEQERQEKIEETKYQPNLVVFSFEGIPLASKYKLFLSEGLPSLEGPIPAVAANSEEFSTYHPLAVEPPRGDSVLNYINFNNQLDCETFDAERDLTVSPPLKEIAASNRTINFYDARAGQTYDVTVNTTIKDVYGQTLKEQVKVQIKGIEYDQKLLSSPFATEIIMDRKSAETTGWKWPYHVRGYKQVRVMLYKLKSGVLNSEFIDRIENDKNNGKTFDGGDLVTDTVVTPDDALQFVDVQAAMTDSSRHFGQMLIYVCPVVEDTDTKKYVPSLTAYVQCTEMSATFFHYEKKCVVRVQKLDGSGAVEGAKINIGTKGEVVTTDQDGCAEFELRENQTFLLIQKDTDILRVGLNNWTNEPHYYVPSFCTTDRGMYRPGEEVKVKGWMRKTGNDRKLQYPIAGSSLTYTIFDGRYQEIQKGVVTVNQYGSFDLSVNLPENANLGQASVQGEGFNTSFQIEEFRRPEFTSSVSVVSEGPYIVDGQAKLRTSASYFSGGPISLAKTAWEVRSTTSHYSPPGWYGYTFGKQNSWRFGWAPHQTDEKSVNLEGSTGGDGAHEITVKFNGSYDDPTPVTISAQATVINTNRQTTSASTSFIVHPSKYYVGIKSAKRIGRPKEEMPYEIVVTGIDGKAVSGRKIKIEHERQYTKLEKNKFVQKQEKLSETELTSSAAPVALKLTAAEEGGNHTIKAVVEDEDGHKHVSTVSVYIAGEQKQEEQTDKPNTPSSSNIEVITDKEGEYQIGDKAHILLKTPFFPAHGHLFIAGKTEKTQKLDFDQSDKLIEIEITEDHLPSFQIVAVVEGYNSEEDLPGYAQATQEIQVSLDSKKLTVSATPERDVLSPGDSTKVKVTVSDHNKQPVREAEVTLIIVDDAILSLSDHNMSDLTPIFHTTNHVNAVASSTRAHVHAPRNIKPQPPANQMLNRHFCCRQRCCCNACECSFDMCECACACACPPGGGGAENKPIKMRSDFNPLVAWVASATTDVEGVITLPVKLSDNLTRYRIWTVATSGPERFGFSEGSMKSELPITVRPSLPRFLNYGDEPGMAVTVLNQSQETRKVSCAMRSENVKIEGSKGFSFELGAGQRTEVTFAASTHTTGKVAVQMAITSGEFADAVLLQLPVYTPSTTEAFATYGDVSSDIVLSQTVSPPRDVIPEFGSLEISLSSTIISSLFDSLKYMHEYPFDCTEQLSSRILSNVAMRPAISQFGDVIKGLPSVQEMDAMMSRDLQKLQNRRVGGGYSFWDSGAVSAYASVHAVHALVRLTKAKQDAGFELDNKTTVEPYVINNLLQVAKQIQDDNCRKYVKMYAMYVQHLYGVDKSQEIVDLLGQEWKKGPVEFVCWALQAIHGKNAELSAEMTRHLLNQIHETAEHAQLQPTVSGSHEWSLYTLGVDRRASGIMLETFIVTQPEHPLIVKLAKGLLAQRSSRGRWLNTQENVFSLTAISAYYSRYERDEPSFTVRQWLGANFVGSVKHEGRNVRTDSTKIPMKYLVREEGDKQVVLQKEGQGRLYYRLGLSYALTSLKIDPRDNGFQVQRLYSGLDRDGDVYKMPDGVWKIKLGARVKVTISVQSRSPRYHTALVDNIPAGLEVLNPALKTTERITDNNSTRPGGFSCFPFSRFWYEHENFRDDRVEVFASYLYQVSREYSYYARATSCGKYIVPPAKIEEMYNPEVFGRSSSETVIIQGNI